MYLFGDGIADLIGSLLGGGGNSSLMVLIVLGLQLWQMFAKPKPGPTPSPSPSPSPVPSPVSPVSLIPDLPNTRIDDVLRSVAGLEKQIQSVLSARSAGDSDPNEKALAGNVAALFKEIHEHTQAASEGGQIDLGRVEKILQLLASLYPILQVLLKLKGVNLPDLPLRPASLLGVPLAKSAPVLAPAIA